MYTQVDGSTTVTVIAVAVELANNVNVALRDGLAAGQYVPSEYSCM
jgi:hypothetical protein